MNHIDEEILWMNVGHEVLNSYKNEIENGISTEFVVRRLVDKMRLTDEMKEKIPSMISKWVQHFETKKNEYVPKSKSVNWLNDVTYNIDIK